MPQRNELSALVPPDPDLSRLPVTFHIGATELFGTALIIAGILGPVVVGGFLALIGLVATGLPDSWGWIVAGFAALPLLAIPWGLWVKKTRTLVRIGVDEVEYLRVTPLRTTQWRAPLAEFDAVAYRRILSPNGSVGDGRHGVQLCHGRGERNLWLVSATEEALARDTLARLAELTGLPAEERGPVRSGA